jgi:hypothetical protein
MTRPSQIQYSFDLHTEISLVLGVTRVILCIKYGGTRAIWPSPHAKARLLKVNPTLACILIRESRRSCHMIWRGWGLDSDTPQDNEPQVSGCLQPDIARHPVPQCWLEKRAGVPRYVNRA